MGQRFPQSAIDEALRQEKARQKAARAAPVSTPPAGDRPHTAAEDEAVQLLRRRLRVFDWQHEGLEVRMRNGHVYTPDWFSPTTSTAVEVKGYRHASVGRSRLAFDQARVERPDIVWLWLERRKASRGRPAHWRLEIPDQE